MTLDISQLLAKECSPCTNKTPRLDSPQITLYLSALPAWQIKKGKLERELKLNDFQESLLLANQIGQIAQKENHHPDLFIGWKILRISLFTHAIQSLCQNDFILAAKIEAILPKSITK